MKAAYYHGNRTIGIESCVPRRPAADEVRIEVAYGGVCGSDLSIFQGHRDMRMRLPMIIGHEMSGTIAEVGAQEQKWREGDRVVVRPLDPCGNCPSCASGDFHVCYHLNFLGVESAGAFQSSWTVPAHTLHRLPASLPLDLAALVEPTAVAYHAVEASSLEPGQWAVVIGGGPIGLLNALVARRRGARVLLAEINPSRLKFARSMGLETVDPLEEDLEAVVLERTGGSGADVVFEVSGTAAGAAAMTGLARARGLIVVVAVFNEAPRIDLFRSFMRELRFCAVRAYEPEDFERSIALIAGGELPLERMISEKHSLDELPEVFAQMESSPQIIKVLLDLKGA